MGKLNLEVVTPGGTIANVEADIVVAPGTEGEFGVLPGHINFFVDIVLFLPGINTQFLPGGAFRNAFMANMVLQI